MYEMVNSLEEEKKKALEDKELAIRLLEERSKEQEMFEQEHDNLTQKLQYLESKLLIGGRKIEETPQFKVIIEEKSKMMQMEYENKLLELDKEKRTVEEEKMLVERYKQLLLKQRDIMIALTSRLNERDETIIALQEEAEMYSKNHKDIEDQNTALIGRIAQLEGRLNENNIKYDKKNINLYGNNGNNSPNKQYNNDEIKMKNEHISKLEEQLEERNRAESFCLKDLLNIVKNFTDTNDRLGFLEGVESVSKKQNLEGKLGNINYLREIHNNNSTNNNNNNNIGNNNNKIHKSVDQMIQEKMRLKNGK